MKKDILKILLLGLVLFTCLLHPKAQTIVDTTVLRQQIVDSIKPNRTNDITAAKLQRILLGNINTLRVGLSTRYAVSDTSQNGIATRKRLRQAVDSILAILDYTPRIALSDTLFNGYATRKRVQKLADSLLALFPDISGKMNKADSVGNYGYASRLRLLKIIDSLVVLIPTNYMPISGGTVTGSGSIEVPNGGMVRAMNGSDYAALSSALIHYRKAGQDLYVVPSLMSGSTTITWPNASGTVALTGDIPVPPDITGKLDKTDSVGGGYTSKASRQKLADSLAALISGAGSFTGTTDITTSTVGANLTVTGKTVLQTLTVVGDLGVNEKISVKKFASESQLKASSLTFMQLGGGGDSLFMTNQLIRLHDNTFLHSHANFYPLGFTVGPDYLPPPSLDNLTSINVSGGAILGGHLTVTGSITAANIPTYSTGVFTPVGNGVTYDSAYGFYEKFDKKITAVVNFRGPVNSDVVNEFRVAGFPYPFSLDSAKTCNIIIAGSGISNQYRQLYSVAGTDYMIAWNSNNSSTPTLHVPLRNSPMLSTTVRTFISFTITYFID